MRPKVFKAETIQKAIADVKEEMGPDAIILSAYKIPKNPNDPYAKGQFAIEVAPKDFCPSQDREDGNKENTIKKDKSISDENFGFIKEELAGIKDIISIVGLGSGMQSMMLNHPGAASMLALLLRAGISEKRVYSIMKAACFAMEKDQAGNDSMGGKNNSIKNNDISCKPDDLASLKKYVIKECINQISVRELFVPQNIYNNSGNFKDSKSEYNKNISGFRNKNYNELLPYMAAFVGPTGAGKTTTIAKLAAYLTFKKQKRVGLISIDNYRVGAFEQLRTYASIMGLGCLPAFTANDFAMAIDKMRSMDIILIDTAGHSHSDKLRMDELASVVNDKFNVSVHLVLSMTTGFIDMKEAVLSFAALNPETYIFTKIDETSRCGKMLDQINEYSMPVSIVTDGQRVPEDLIIPDKKALLSIILGTEHAISNKD